MFGVAGVLDMSLRGATGMDWLATAWLLGSGIGLTTGMEGPARTSGLVVTASVSALYDPSSWAAAGVAGIASIGGWNAAAGVGWMAGVG